MKIPNIHKSTKDSILKSHTPNTQIKNDQYYANLISYIFMFSWRIPNQVSDKFPDSPKDVF